MRLFTYLWLPLLLLSCTLPPKEGKEAPRFVASKRPPITPNKATPFTFGYLEVPENRDRPGGKVVKLPVYIFKSRSANPAPDPVILTFGGPGSSSLAAAQYMKYYRYLDDRDLILFEQRGTRYALPHLTCPEWGAVARGLSGTLADDQAWQEAYVKAAADCRSRLEGASIDLSAYRTLETVRDIEDLRRVLNLGKINLLTTSYGTKIAQVMLREYPESLRSVVMDSALPLSASWDTASSTNLMEMLQRVYDDCAANLGCNAKYPDLAERFTDYLNGLNAQPREIKVSNGGGDKRFSFTATDILELLSGVSTSEVPGIPARMETLMAGDNGLLETYAQQLAEPSADGVGMGMRLSVWCAEETAFTTSEAVARERRRNPILRDRSPMVFSFEVCRAWGVAAAEREKELVTSTIPVLLISGTYDAITPTKWAEQLREQLPNSFLLTFPGWTHGPFTNWSNLCAMEAANDFLNTPKQLPKPGCYEEVNQPVVFE